MPKKATFQPPGVEKLIFSDKTLACSIDCAPKHMDVDNSDNSNNNARFKSMDIENTVSAFALIFAAVSIALILLFIEVKV